MDEGGFDDDDPTVVDDPAAALDAILARVGELSAKMRGSLPRVRRLDRDARKFLARAIHNDFLRLTGELELIAPLVIRSLE